MYSRETTFQGPYDPRTLIEQIQNTVVPGVSVMSGFLGIHMDGDPSSGTVWAYTDWETPEALIASRRGADDLRRQTAQEAELTILGVREWDVPAAYTSDRPPTPGLPINVNRHLYDPTILHEVVSFFVWAAEPLYVSSPGLRALRMLVDRTTGEVGVGSAWDDVESLEKGFAIVAPVRDRAVEKGLKFVERGRREVLFWLAQ